MNPLLPLVVRAADEAAIPELAPTGGTYALALIVGTLFAGGCYLALQRSLTQVILGFGLLTHGANVLIMTAGGRLGEPPFIEPDGSGPIVDPLPQAFSLTAIVISMAVTALLVALAYRSMALTEDDFVPNDPEDRRIQESSDMGGEG